jgi:hypothetical protein
VLLIDFSKASKDEILALLYTVQKTVAAQPQGSLLVLADFDQAEIDKEVATRMKEVLVFDRPFVKRAAWFCAESMPKVFYESFKTFSRRDLPIFKTREEALDWLVGEEDSKS